MNPSNFIKLPLKILATLGFDMPCDPNDSSGYRFRTMWIFPIIAINLIYETIGQVNEAILSHKNGESLYIVATFVFTLVYVISTFSKGILLLLERQCFNDLIIKLDKIFPRTEKQQRDYRLNEYLREFNRMAISIAVLQLVLGQYFGWSTMIVDYFSSRAENRTFEIALPFGENYPFYSYTPISFVLMFISQVFVAYTVTATVYSVNILLCGLIWQLCMHYSHLMEKLKSFDETESEYHENEHLIWCIKEQNYLNG